VQLLKLQLAAAEGLALQGAVSSAAVAGQVACNGKLMQGFCMKHVSPTEACCGSFEKPWTTLAGRMIGCPFSNSLMITINAVTSGMSQSARERRLHSFILGGITARTTWQKVRLVKPGSHVALHRQQLT
jgi:hypothetical protein